MCIHHRTDIRIEVSSLLVYGSGSPVRVQHTPNPLAQLPSEVPPRAEHSVAGELRRVSTKESININIVSIQDIKTWLEDLQEVWLRVTCVAAAVHLAVVARVVGEGDDVEHVEQLAHPRPLGLARPQHRHHSHHRPPARPRHAARRLHRISRHGRLCSDPSL